MEVGRQQVGFVLNLTVDKHVMLVKRLTHNVARKILTTTKAN